MSIIKRPLYVVLVIISAVFWCSCASGGSGEQEPFVPPVEGSRVPADKILKQIAKGQNVFYKKITVAGDLDFTLIEGENPESQVAFRNYIATSVTFAECIFDGKVSTFRKGENNERHNVTFDRNLSFLKCIFMNEVDFNGTNVKGTVDFSYSEFFKKAIFEGVYFSSPVINFNNTKYSEELRFQRAVFDGDVSFLNSVFEGITSFQSAIFKGNLQMGACKFAKYADFGRITNKASSFFNYAEFEDQAIFSEANFNGRTEFIECKFKHYSEFIRIRFGGSVKYCKSSFNGKLDFSFSVFMLGKPDMTEIIKSDDLEIILENTTYSNQQAVLPEIF